MAELGQFARRFDEWRKLIATVPQLDDRVNMFTRAAHDMAECITNGLDKTAIADELNEIAVSFGFMANPGADDVQTIIADAFRQQEEQAERVPDWARDDQPQEQQRLKTNGQTKPKTLNILTKAAFLAGLTPPRYLITNILQRAFIYSLTGQTGHAKTAVALLIARLIGSPSPNLRLGPHRVKHGRVIYFVGENPDDVRMRVIGMDFMREDDPNQDRISFIPGVFNITEMFSVLESDMYAGGEASLIIVDTSAAYFLGSEELNNVQMGAHARILRRLTTLPGKPTALVLCHPVKHVTEQNQLLPRGGGAFLAEMDGNLTLWRMSDDMIELHHTGKFRGPEFAPVTFRLEPIRNAPGLMDADGNQMSTVHAVTISQVEEDKQMERITLDEDRLLAAMLKDPKQSYTDLAGALGWVLQSGAVDKKKTERVIKRLEVTKPKLVVRNRYGWALTDAGKKQAAEAALRFDRERVANDQLGMEL